MRLAPVSVHVGTSEATPSMHTASRTVLGMSCSTFGKFSSPLGRACGERLIAFLRERYPQKTADCVAADTGIPATNVAKWLSGASLPNFRAVIALLIAYDVDFWAAVVPNPPAFVVRERTEQQIRELEDGIAQQRRELEALRQ